MSEHDKAVAEIADFESWWRKNHPFDWWASERGEPLDSYTRLLVWDKCKDAWEAAINEALGRVGRDAERYRWLASRVVSADGHHVININVSGVTLADAIDQFAKSVEAGHG